MGPCSLFSYVTIESSHELLNPTVLLGPGHCFISCDDQMVLHRRNCVTCGSTGLGTDLATGLACLRPCRLQKFCVLRASWLGRRNPLFPGQSCCEKMPQVSGIAST